LLNLRDRTAGAPPDSPRDLAWLWACAALDVRCDHILIPILVTPEDLPLLETLARLNRDRAWQLPPDYFSSRLARGGCLLILSEPDLANPYPNCPTLP
jgi:hypothetical protein